MRIAITALFYNRTLADGYGSFSNTVINGLIGSYPEHEFILLIDKPFDLPFVQHANVRVINVSPKIRHPLATYYWYNVSAPAVLRKFKPDVWLQPYGFCSLTSSIPQLLVVHDLAFVHHPEFIQWYHAYYYRFYTPRSIKKAKWVLTVSDFSKQDIIKHYAFSGKKITVVANAANQLFAPVDWDKKVSVKEKYTGGNEYFLFTGSIHPRKNLMNLLKAFGQFKKWQHSNMKLLIVGRLAWKYDVVIQKLKTFKYRHDVILTGYLSDDELINLTGAAYAIIYPSFFEGFGLPILEAMQSGVPVIASNTSSMPEIAGDAALLVSPDDPTGIAEQMLLLYKNEPFRANLIEKGLKRAKHFDAGVTIAKFCERLQWVAGQR